ncbi:MAG TPA: TrmB family transcriptional regulator [Thermoanaerobacterales bacterium]|nr:TrmB family transcriptional regulator [Thermoanaerobacterales bacterium]
MKQLIQVFRQFNYTQYEAQVYITLLQNGPQTGYEVSKMSGVPRSKVYNVLEKLTNRGAVVTAQGEKNVLYKAEPIQRLINLAKTSFNDCIQILERETKKYTYSFDDEQIWKIFDYPSILEKCKEMIDSAENELMIQIWMEELEGDIEELLLTKEKQNDFNLVTVLYDRKEKYHTELRQIYKHGFEVSKLREMGNRWITVVTDGKEMLHAAVHNFVSAEAIYTKNNNMVFFAREHVKHDAYCLRLIDILTEQIKQQFGEDMEGIRDVFVIP